MPNELVIRDQITEALADSLHRGKHGLSVLPKLWLRALQEHAWGERIVRVTGERFPGFSSPEAWVAAAPPEGLGGDNKVFRDLLQGDPVAVDAWDKVTGNHQGMRTDLLDNIQEVKAPTGASPERALRRLRKDRPDLHARVLAHELSPHAAAIEAGFRHRMANVRLDDPAKAVAILLKHFTRDELLTALEATR